VIYLQSPAIRNFDIKEVPSDIMSCDVQKGRPVIWVPGDPATVYVGSEGSYHMALGMELREKGS
jgi:hypothetical protein